LNYRSEPIKNSSRIWRLLVLVLVLCSTQFARPAKDPAVPQKYAHWLNKEVNYLITSDERSVFLRLPSDDARDKFIESFWNLRNPAINAPTNVFKEEHYRRIEYANQHFGSLSLEDGESTDRGMVYITLGAPAQIQAYPESKSLRPLQIWFYQNTSGALPIHFNVLFYKESPIEDYRLYSPTGDRPQKLINGTAAVNNDAYAVKMIGDDLGVEVAHVCLSLIPGEPVDLKNPTPSMQSDILLSNIRNYWNLPINKQSLATRRGQLESVSHRVILGEQFTNLTTFISRGPGTAVSLDYLFRFREPRDLGLAQQPDGRYYYSFSMEARLKGPDGKEIYKDVRKIANYLTERRFQEISRMTFGVEGKLAIAPGKYELQLYLTNEITRQVFQQTRTVIVPAFDHPLAISPVFFAGNGKPQTDLAGELPFSFSGIKLSPIGSDNASIPQGTPLRIIFQLWEAPGNPEQLRSKTLTVNYLIGQLGSQDKKEEEQIVDRGGFDPSGNLLLGKDIETDSISPGNYRLVIKVTNPQDHSTVYQSLNFEVTTPAASAPLWTAIAPPLPSPQEDGTGFYRAGLCSLANQHLDEAVQYFQQALASRSTNLLASRALAATYRKQGNVSAAEAIDRKISGIAQP
jgi:GWxTD domain-containing protein